MSDTRVNVYFLPYAAKEKALCALLEKLRGEKILVLASGPQRVERLDAVLWTYHPHSFLAHGRSGDDFADQQPIWLSESPDHSNGATVLVMFEPMAGIEYSPFRRWIVLVDPLDADDQAHLDTLRATWKKDGLAPRAFLSDQGKWQRLEDEGAWPSASSTVANA